MTNQLIKLNSLQLNAQNIWINPADMDEFNYSDGADEEAYLLNTLKAANDLSVDSNELKKAVRDWVCEYHLGSVRANLLASINFPKQGRVLEVGCGCGAISRFLGEHNTNVDAVEGSAIRAQIAQLRTRDQENVRVIKHNFNTLALPENYYDTIFFIGVLEYAKRFINDEKLTSEQAVISLLTKAAASLTTTGTIIVAIENRTGLKYKKGAFEDHLARANVGLDNYQGYESTGIKTFDAQQWQLLTKECGLSQRLFFPFADYKFPELVINAQVAQKDSAFLASQITSRDPISTWVMPESEDSLWHDIISANELHAFSNSFGLALSKDKENLEQVFSHAWTLYDPSHIKPELRLNINENSSKISLYNNDIERSYKQLPESFIALKSDWQEQINEPQALQLLAKLCADLYQQLEEGWPQRILVDCEQLFVSDDKTTLAYAKFWRMNVDISPVQQLFHYLFGFLQHQRKRLSNHASFKYLSLYEVIEFCLHPMITTSKQSVDSLVNAENNFRQQSYHHPQSVEDEMRILVSNHNITTTGHLNSQLFWASQSEAFHPDHSQIQRLKQIESLQTISFLNLERKHKFLRFDPSDHEYGNGYYFCLHEIIMTDKEDSSVSLINTNALNAATIESFDLEMICSSKLIFKITGPDPQLKFSLPDDLKNLPDRYNLDFKLQWLGI